MTAGWWAARAAQLLVALAAAPVLVIGTGMLAPGDTVLDWLTAVPVLLGITGLLAAALTAARPLLPIVAARTATAAGGRISAGIGGQRRAPRPTPYAALAAATTHLRAGCLERALAGVAAALAGGTAARGARIWLAVGERLVATAEYPPRPRHPGDRAGPVIEPNLAVVLSRPDTTLAAPVLDNTEHTCLRAVLTIDKPTTAITVTDRALLADVATAASLLLRRAAQHADYTEQLRQAKDLATQAEASRQRLASAGELARRRLITELDHLTAARFTALRSTVGTALDAITALISSSADPDAAPPSDAPRATDLATACAATNPDAADTTETADTADTFAADVGAAGVAAVQDALHQARVTLDQLLAGFRIIARGVYPAVLRDEGPAAALGELITDLPRPVQVTGGLGGRLQPEVEAGLYYVAAAALQQLARTTTAARLSLHLQHADGRVSVLVHDPAPATGTTDLTTALCDDVERLAALGGAIELRGASSRPLDPRDNPLELRAWLPDRLEPVVETPPVPPPSRWAPARMVEVGNPARAGRENRAAPHRPEPDRPEPDRAEPDPAEQGSGEPDSGEPDHNRAALLGAPPVTAARGGTRRRRTRRRRPPRVDGRAAEVTRRILARTAVIGLVAVVATAAQLLLVSAAVLVLGDHTTGGGLAVPIAASVAVGLALLPLHRLATSVVDRLLYGRRPDPYRVLAQVTAAAARMMSADTPDLVRLTHALGEALDARACRLTVRRPGLPDRAYHWPSASAAVAAMVEVSIRYGQDIVGSLAVDERTITAAQPRHRLQHDIADSLAVVVQANRTSVDVERQLREALAHADDIAAARRSLVADMERERRRIERDLHDGVQGHLVSLSALTALVDHQVAAGQLGAARERLDQIAAYLDVAEYILDQTVQEVSHPLHRPPRPRNRPGQYSEHGEHGEPGQHSDQSEHSLIAALRHAVDDGHPAVVVDADLGVDVAIAPPLAATIYYCCLEAINNARTHAQPDTIALRVSRSDGRLRFTVTDDGIGYDTCAHRDRSAGRGLRNVRARLATVGGHLDIHSQAGRGTTVDAAVPLTPAPIGPADDAPPDVGPPLAAPRPALGGGGLIDRVRDAARDARDLYHGSACAHRLRVLADRLDQPPRIGITTTNPQPAATAATDASPRPSAPPAPPLVGAIAAALRTSRVAVDVVELTTPARPTPRGGDERADIAIGVAVRVECLNAMPAGSGPNQPNIDDDNPDRTADGLTADADAGFPAAGPPTFRVLTRPGLTTGTSGTDRPPAAAGPTGAGPATAAGPPGDIAEPGDRPARPAGAAVEAVVAVDAQLATVSAALTEQHFQRLRHLAGHVPGLPVDEELTEELGPAATQLAVQLLRGGPTSTRAELVQQLATASGLTRLVALVEAAVRGREEVVVARAVLGELEQLVRDQPPAHGGQALRYELERIRAGRHELTELDLVDALRVGQLRVPDAHRDPVLRVLGGYGGDPRTRLGLPADAHPARLPAAAAAQREHWHRLATHPAATAHLHTVATAATHTCDQLLGRA